MSDGSTFPVLSHEMLARFIFSRHHIRQADRTVKPDAFIPPRDQPLSVIRHNDLEEQGLWSVGRAIEKLRQRSLHGRADVRAAVFEMNGLEVVAAPLPDIAQHAEVTRWPPEKPRQKAIAQKVAMEAGKVREVPPDRLEP